MWTRAFVGCAIAAGLGAEVLAGNRAPRAELLVLEVRAGEPTVFTLLATDPDGDPLVFSILGGPEHGKLEGTPPNLTYVPFPGFVGTDGFTFSAVDLHGAMDVGMVQLRVSFEITTRWVGPEPPLLASAFAGLARHLAQEGPEIWYIFTQPAGPFSPGERISVLLPPRGSVAWVSISKLQKATPLAVVWDWDPCGLLCAVAPTTPGEYLLSVVKGREAFSFVVVVKGSLPEGFRLAAFDEIKGGW